MDYCDRKRYMNWLKENWLMIILIVILISLDIFMGELFYTILLFYGLLIKFFFSNLVTGKLRKILVITIWTIFIIIFSLGYYVNNYLPHGHLYPTGDIVCMNDDRGPCKEEYVEDMRELNIPDWAKFIRNNGILLLMGLGFAGLVLSKRNKD